MSYAPSIIVERLLDAAVAAPWDLAPKAVQAAAKAADSAISVHLDALSQLDDAEVGIPIAEAAWQQAGKAAIREGADLPTRDGIQRANLALDVAREDEHLADLKLQGARHALGSLLADPAVRDEWRTAVEARAVEIQTGLAKTAATIAGPAIEAGTLLSYTHVLGAWGEHVSPPAVVTVDAAGALHKLANLRPWTPAAPLETVPRRQGPIAEDKRPPVWIINDGGGIHDIHAKNAAALLDQPGWRLATEAEIGRERKRQGLTR
jgi:hypothetical protein